LPVENNTAYARHIRDLKHRFNQPVERAWEAVGQEYFDKLSKSMPRSIQGVIEAKGWYTKYEAFSPLNAMFSKIYSHF
jgi:hypothetical protein